MKSNKSVIKSYRITPEEELNIQLADINMQDFISRKLQEEFRIKFSKKINQDITQKEKEIDNLKKLKKKLDPTPKTPEEIQFMKETKILVKSNPEYLIGRIKYYSNYFNKILLTEKEFKELLKKAK